MKNNENYAYDIKLSDNNELIIVKYKVVDESFENSKGKIVSKRNYVYYGFEYPENIELRIKELLLQGYHPITDFGVKNTNIVSFNPLTNLELFLGKYCILEQFYSLGSGYNNMNLKTFITCINIKNGKISSKAIRSYSSYDENTIKELEEQGYVLDEKSFYNSYINALNNDSNLKR